MRTMRVIFLDVDGVLNTKDDTKEMCGPFYGIEEYEIEQYCDSSPLNCCWLSLVGYFKKQEEKENVE